MKTLEVYIIRNGKPHCICKLSASGEILQLLKSCFPADSWDIKKLEEVNN